MNKTQLLNRAADNIRILAAAAVEKAKSGHPGGAMGGADFINVLFSEFLEYDPENPGWEARDRFFLDPGHMAPMLYGQLCLAGKFTLEDLKNLRQWGSVTPGHPEREIERMIENTSGPLGQGHTFAVGAAIAAKWFNQRYGEIHNPTIYAFISDGGVQEEISQGAGRLAGHLGLDNLVMFYDSNTIQLSTGCGEVTSEDVAAKYKAWGWYVQEIPGNDPDAIREALIKAKAHKGEPSLIIGHTIMGKGCVTAEGANWEGKCSTHGAPLSKAGASFEKTIEHLGGNPEDPFQIFPEVKKLYDDRAAELRELCNKKYEAYYEWKQANPLAANEYETYMSGETPCIDWSLIQQKAGAATRNASGTVLSFLAENVGNMIVSSADLSNSEDPRLQERRFQRSVPPSRCVRTHHGVRHDRNGAPRRNHPCLRHVLRLQRLYETCCPHGGAHGTAGEIHLEPRRLPRRRRRTDPRAGRARGADSSHGETA